MKLELLCKAAGIRCPDAEISREISAIETDSRRVKVGAMFVCIRGLHVDGHAYIAEAVRAGASCILVQRDCEWEAPKGVLILQSENTRCAAARLYHAWYGFPAQRLKIIGVTGTNGKTSVTCLLRAILEAALCRCGLIGTVGCESAGRRLQVASATDPLANMTTPDPAELYRVLAEMVEDRVEYVLMEVTSHALALDKLDPIEFEAAIFTNLTPEHLDFHGTMEAYAEAKARLFSKSRLAIFNGDSPYAAYMKAHTTGPCITCAIDGDADYVAENRSQSESGVSYDLSSRDSRIRISCPIAGDFSVMNSMQAAVCALQLGLGASVIKAGISSVMGVRGRMERVKLGLGAEFRVLIDYAHTPDALENLLRTARQMLNKGERLVLLFGCGGDRDRTKRPVMGKIASAYADAIILTSDNSRSEEPEAILSEILTGIDPKSVYTVIPDRKEAIDFAIQQAKKGDLILLAGKGHEEYEITKEGRRPFCERELVRKAFRLRQGSNPTIESTETEL